MLNVLETESTLKNLGSFLELQSGGEKRIKEHKVGACGPSMQRGVGGGKPAQRRLELHLGIQDKEHHTQEVLPDDQMLSETEHKILVRFQTL